MYKSMEADALHGRWHCFGIALTRASGRSSALLNKSGNLDTSRAGSGRFMMAVSFDWPEGGWPCRANASTFRVS